MKLILEGEPAHVEAMARILREFLTVQEEGRNQTIPLSSPPRVRRILRVLAPTVDP